MKKNLLLLTMIFLIAAYANSSIDQISESEPSTYVSVEEYINADDSNAPWFSPLLDPSQLNIADEDILTSLELLVADFEKCVLTFNAGCCDEQKVCEDYLILQEFYLANTPEDTPLANKITENITCAKARVKESVELKVKLGITTSITDSDESVSLKKLEERYNKTLASYNAGVCEQEAVLANYLIWQEACLANTPVDSDQYNEIQKSIAKAKSELVTILKFKQKLGQDVDSEMLKELEEDIEQKN